MHSSTPAQTSRPADHPDRGALAIDTHIHLFEEHLSAAAAAGLGTPELHERTIDDEWVRLKPRWEKHRDWPISFAWVWHA